MSLTFEKMKEIIDSLVYMEHWHLEFIDRGPGKLEIFTDLIPNSRYDAGSENEEVSLFRREYVPEWATTSEMNFLRWVLYEVLWLSMHENIEWLRYKVDGKPVFDAHDAETTATRLLPPRPGEQWWSDTPASTIRTTIQ